MTEINCESDEDPSGSNEEQHVITGYTSVEQFTKDGFKTLMEAIKHSNALPSGRDWDFYNTSDSFKKIINDESNNVMRLMNQVMRCNELGSNIRNRVLDEKVELIIEANDVILEKVANNIDDLNGIRKTVAAPVVLQTVSAQIPINGSWNKPTIGAVTINSPTSRPNENCIKLLTGKNILRPQKFFKDKVDNRNKVPWYPRITDKPNSLKPLAIFLEESDERQEFSHPYDYELFRFAPTPEQLLEEKPQLPEVLSDTPLIEIDKPEQLEELVEILRGCKEFAVDVEHHSYRSFMGITCVLQISTEDKDYLIDTLALRDKLYILNEVFTKNTIVKIFHGADKDVEWLQRDLSIYVVNMFDTHQAAKILQYQGLSLAYLLKKFCDVLPNKQYQLADWRIRPLPEELKEYAREDTHYLIYIYKMLKKELLTKGNKSDNLLKSVIELSTDICRKRYFKPILLDDSHLDIYRKCKKLFDNRQMYALKEIYAWRDNLAREEDESLGYVLPNHMLLQISETLPREMQGILACCNPVPPLVRSHLLELHHIVLRAREQPLEKAIMKDTTGRGVLKKVSKVNVDSVLHCPHDLSKSQEFRDDLPTLLLNDLLKTDNRNLVGTELVIEKSSSYSVFASSDTDDVFNERDTFKKLRGFAYFSPFERYKLVKPFVVAEEQAAKAQRDETKKKEESKKTDEEKTQERTDDDRIASIKDHFIQLSRKFSEELQAQKAKEEEEQRQRERSLIEMGGSRKRKREEIDSYSIQQGEISINDFQSSVPNVNRNKFQANKRRNKGKKRKFSEVTDNYQEEQVNEGNVSGKKKKKKKNKQNQQQQYQMQQQQQQMHQQQQQMHQQQQQMHQKQQNWKQRPRPKRQLQSQSHPNQQQQVQHQNPNKVSKKQNNQNQLYKRLKKKKQVQNQRDGFQQFDDGGNGQMANQQKKKFKQNKGNNNQNQNFSPYDYASVDFRQFQGGAGSASSGVQIKRTFKGKNQKNRNKKGAKSATFAGVKTNRGAHQTRN